MQKIISIIPARKGSKSILLKNIKKLLGKPLLVYSIEVALLLPSIKRVIVSTDSEEIAEIAKEYGAEVPFLRPRELAKDDTPDIPVFVHCLEWLKRNEEYVPDIIVHLRPTSPLRTVEMLKSGIELLIKNPEADSVRSVCVPHQTPYKMWLNENGFIVPLIKSESFNNVEMYNQPRQKLPKVYWQNASVDVVRYSTIMEKHSMTGERIVPLVMEERDSIDIDSDIDFIKAEAIMRTLGNKEKING